MPALAEWPAVQPRPAPPAMLKLAPRPTLNQYSNRPTKRRPIRAWSRVWRIASRATRPQNGLARHTQFQKGRSGNPSGKRKREESYAELLKEELDRLIPIRENGKTITLTMRKAWVKRVVNGAIQGNREDEKILMMIEKPDLSPRKGGELNIYDVDSEDEIPPH